MQHEYTISYLRDGAVNYERGAMSGDIEKVLRAVVTHRGAQAGCEVIAARVGDDRHAVHHDADDDRLNPECVFSTAATAILRGIVAGTVDAKALAAHMLQVRGE